MNIIRTFGGLAREFLEQEVEAFEYMLATKGGELVIDEYEWRDNWQGYGSYDPYIEVSLSLFSEREICVDSIKEESYQIIYKELDDFLIRKDNHDLLNIDKYSDDYKVLARRFLLAKIEAIDIMVELCQGKSYNYTVKTPINEKPPTRKKRAQTLLIESYIDIILPKVLKYATGLTKGQIAEDVAFELEEDYKIIRKPSAVLSEYLQNHPLMK